MPPRCQKAGSVGVIYPTGILQRDTMDEVCALAMDFMFTDIHILVISFRDVTALLSEGIRLLVNIHDKVESLKKVLHVCDLPKEVHYTLKITNLLQFLGHKDSLALLLKEKGIEETALQDFDPDADTPSDAPAPVSADAPAAPAPQAAPPTAATPEPEAPKAKEDAPADTPPPGFGNSAQSAGEELARRDRERITRLFGNIKTLGSQKDGDGSDSHDAKAPKKTTLDKNEVIHVINYNVPSRICFRIMRHFIERKKDTLSLSEIAEAISEKEKLIKRDIQRLITRGMLKHLGGDVYNCNAAPDVVDELTILFKMYDAKDTHSLVLSTLIANEQ